MEYPSFVLTLQYASNEMNAKIEYQLAEEKLTISIFPIIKPIVKAGLYLQSFMFLSVGLTFLSLVIFSELRLSKLFIMVLTLGLALGCFLLSKAYLNKIFQDETIVVTKSNLLIIEKYIFSTKKLKLSINTISNLRFAGTSNTNFNSLENGTLGTLGLGITQKETDYVIADGAISLFSNGITKKFGRNLASWQAEEAINKIIIFTGNDLLTKDNLEKLKRDLATENVS